MSSKDASLFKSIFLRIAIINLITIGLIGTVWVASINSYFSYQKSVLENSYVDNQRANLKSIVSNVRDYIHYKQGQIEDRIKNDLKTRVTEAIRIADHLYQNHKFVSEDEREFVIKEALRPIRFNQGRGYYFAFDLNGIEILFADKPEMEVENLLGLVSTDQKYVIRDMIDIARHSKEGFYTYDWTKPGEPGENHQKLAYFELYEPLGWVFGTGAYLEDMENEIKLEVLDRVSKIAFGQYGYIFIGQWDGMSLSFPAKGKNMINVTDVNGVKVVQELIQKSKEGGGYLTYVMPPLNNVPSKQKLAYTEPIEKWKWYIGSGIFLDEIDSQIQQIDLSTHYYVKQAIATGVILLVVALLILTWILRWYEKKVQDTYQSFLNFFKDAIDDEALLDTTQIEYLEHQKLADAAQGMIQARQMAERRVKRLAFYDPLTNLPNRRLGYDRLNQAIQHARTSAEKIGLLFIDLDHFKQVNDLQSHEAGDMVLKMAAERLSHCLDEKDTAARIGGDEFLAILPAIRTEMDAEKTASEIIEAFKKPFLVENLEFNITVSIGISLWPINAEDAQSLLNGADTAMTQVKNSGRNAYHFFTDELDIKSKERIFLQRKLHHAIEHGLLSVFYQPIVDTQSGEIVMAEALLRWQDEDYGFIPPDRFIPIAEDSGLITDLGDFVLKTACAQFVEWKKQGLPIQKISINASSRQFVGPHFLETLKRVVNDLSCDPQNLSIEITESILLENVEEVERYLEEISSMGIGISIDDFGTGYSSLSYLSKFPFSTIKIDKSFTQESMINVSSAKLVETIVSLGLNLDLKVIAEGVEEVEQVEFLQRLNCDFLQGFFYSKPLPAEDFVGLFDSTK